MRLFPALITMWSDRESAFTSWRDAAAPMVEDLGFTALSASLIPDRRGQTPTQALLTSLSSGADPGVSTDTDGFRVDQAIEGLLDRWWRNEKSLVLFLEGLEKWRAPRWRSDASAFRAVAQANQQRLFVVYVCVDRVTLRHVFQDVREPLYREGSIVVVSAEGRG